MSSEFGNDYVTISDDDGNDYMLEHIDTIEIEGNFYMAFLPADVDENDDNYGLVIFTVEKEDGEDVLVSIDDEGFLEELFERFKERFYDEDEE